MPTCSQHRSRELTNRDASDDRVKDGRRFEVWVARSSRASGLHEDGEETKRMDIR